MAELPLKVSRRVFEFQRHRVAAAEGENCEIHGNPDVLPIIWLSRSGTPTLRDMRLEASGHAALGINCRFHSYSWRTSLSRRLNAHHLLEGFPSLVASDAQIIITRPSSHARHVDPCSIEFLFFSSLVTNFVVMMLFAMPPRPILITPGGSTNKSDPPQPRPREL
jgi:hypothetical protein